MNEREGGRERRGTRDLRDACYARRRERKAEDATDFASQSEQPDRPGTRVNDDVGVERRRLVRSSSCGYVRTLLLHGPNRVLLELVEMPRNFAVQMLGQHADVAEERPEDVEFLGEQFNPLLQQIVVFHQQFNLFFGLA